MIIGNPCTFSAAGAPTVPGGFPSTYAMSVRPGSGCTTPNGTSVLCENTYRMCVSGSNDPPGQFVPPPNPDIASVAMGPSGFASTGGVKIGPSL